MKFSVFASFKTNTLVILNYIIPHHPNNSKTFIFKPLEFFRVLYDVRKPQTIFLQASDRGCYPHFKMLCVSASGESTHFFEVIGFQSCLLKHIHYGSLISFCCRSFCHTRINSDSMNLCLILFGRLIYYLAIFKCGFFIMTFFHMRNISKTKLFLGLLDILLVIFKKL